MERDFSQGVAPTTASVPAGGIEPTSTVEVSISCRNLLDLDLFSRSDPMCVIYRQNHSSEWIEILRTETIWDNLNPDFATKIYSKTGIKIGSCYNYNYNHRFIFQLTIDYRFEEEQNLRFEIYDIDSPSYNLAKHDFLGFSECTLGQIVSGGFKGLYLPLSQNRSKYYPILPKGHKKSKGSILLISEELTHLKENVTIKLEGDCLGDTVCSCLYPPRIFFVVSKSLQITPNPQVTSTSSNKNSKSDIEIQIQAIEEPNSVLHLHNAVNGHNSDEKEVENVIPEVVVYRSEAKVGPNPAWEPFTLSVQTICNGDKESRMIRWQIFQVGLNGYHRTLGSYETTLSRIVGLVENPSNVPLKGSKGKEKKGRLNFLKFEITPIFTFVEYIRSGTQIHACFAIDFTASNGDPNDNDSLHHVQEPLTPGQPGNPYEQAILSVGEIIQDYSLLKQFPVYGFGARIPPNGTISNKFMVTLKESPYCTGITGVLEAYKDCIRQIQLSGPTQFSPIIEEVASLAKKNQNGRQYYILVIITDGIINDMEATKESIVKAATLPLSIIICGVGNANFSAMDELDGDVIRVSFQGQEAERDIVQFVPYRDSQSWMQTVCPEVAGRWSSSHETMTKMAKVKLAQEVLAEIPDQVTSFMISRDITPADVKEKTVEAELKNP